MGEKSLAVLSKEGLARFQKKPWVKQLISSSGMPLILQEPVSEKRVYLVIDCSTSMSWKGKMNQAREGAIGFALEAQEKFYSVGLISFASEARHLLEPQFNLAIIMEAVQQLKAKGSTNMADAIIMATEMLSGISGERVMCLVTDGQPDSDEETLEAVENAKNEGIEIMCIGTDDADFEFLEKLATRKELSVKVEATHLEQGITQMAGLLPDRSKEAKSRR